MSNHDNPRRDELKRTEHGPRWETRECDSPSVAHARKKWKQRAARAERRTDGVSNAGYHGGRKLGQRPEA
jgi:hypothetical protein